MRTSVFIGTSSDGRCWPLFIPAKPQWPLLILGLDLFSCVICRLPDGDLDRLCAIITVMSHDAARFRKQAEEATEQAAKAFSPLDKAAWLRVAEESLKLALSDESRK